MTGNCTNGVAVYAAFWEVIPGNGPQLLNPLQYTVFPGDFVDVEITHEEPNKFNITIKDGWWSFSTTQIQADMEDALSSADFVTEAPGDTTQPLTNFGTAHFQNCWANNTP